MNARLYFSKNDWRRYNLSKPIWRIKSKSSSFFGKMMFIKNNAMEKNVATFLGFFSSIF